MFRAQSNKRKRSLCVESESQPNKCKWANETTNETRCLAQFVLIETRLWLNSIVTKTISWQFCAVMFVFRRAIQPNQGNPTQLRWTTIWSHVSCWSLLSQWVLSKQIMSKDFAMLKMILHCRCEGPLVRMFFVAGFHGCNGFHFLLRFCSWVPQDISLSKTVVQ